MGGLRPGGRGWGWSGGRQWETKEKVIDFARAAFGGHQPRKSRPEVQLV